MQSYTSRNCPHPDVRNYGGLRSCLSCGFTIASPRMFSDDLLLNDKFGPSTATEYHYQPLHYELGQEMRLLHLKPGKFQEDLECEIVHYNLLDKPRYEAISYTWTNEDGNDMQSSRIRYVGSNCFVRITANCEAALRRVRMRTSTRVIWIDSICINQNNTNERNHQVRQMGHIYASARQVIIYLGEQSWSSRQVFRYFANAVVVRRKGSVLINFPGEQYRPSKRAVIDFLSRRWFHRLWVMQEVGLARRATILCGKESLDWSFFSVERFAQGGLSSLAVGDIIPGVLLLETNFYKQKPSMIDLLHAGRNSLSSDPRDKVFALLSLGDANDDLKIQPDYAQTVEWLFTDVAVQSMKNGTCLDILAHVRGQSQYRSLPSWVPDWTLSVREKPLRDQFSDAEIAFVRAWNLFTLSSEVPLEKEKLGAKCRMHNLSILSLAQDCQPVRTTRNRWQIHQGRTAEDMRPFQLYTPQDSHSPGLSQSLSTRLVVRANRLATVSFPLQYASHNCTTCPGYGLPPLLRPSGSCTLISSSPQCSKVLEFWSHILPDPRTKGLIAIEMNTSIPPAFGSRVTCPSCGPYKNKCDVVPSDDGDDHVATYHDIGTYRNIARPDFHYSKTALESFKLQQARYGDGRALFRTEGSLGLGPYALRGGETVWLVDHCSVAMALRRVDGHYVVVGECYIYGALNARYPCPRCGLGVQCAEPIETETIEIW